MWAIRDKKSHQYYDGETFYRTYNDYRPTWSNPDDPTNADLFANKEFAENFIKISLKYEGDLEAVEL